MVESPETAEDTGSARRSTVAIVPDGPYDAAEAPDDGINRLDLGSLRLPALPGVEVQFQVGEATGEPLTVLVTDGRSAMELSVFAAPKSRGLWDEVRAEILETVEPTGGKEAGGSFGRELRMSLPTGRPGESVPARMIGVDGPRWFLRAVVTGVAGQDPGAAPLLEETLRQLVVARGDGAMPVRDPLPLTLPRDITDHPDGPGAATSATSGRAEMPTPGVRIAEIR
ncbi:DUF3710 domain-containing protein [Frankia sp. AgB32]|uniref:DUF3710 domain-containing protein n=1 Tax=Frankia sp. AgB32 TaxID=631119 RepID=UPI00200EE322|nr:DUF3710 domain-containing protein [Frankia sp. AgB32]MCK9897268.1 DUF3710 domain-containing protein [Frankia sp. AgB32]